MKQTTEIMNSSERTQQADLVVQKLTECQSRLFAFIYSLTADSELAWDVLQETNQTLWKKVDEYDSTRDFLPWAMTHAFNQLRTARKKHQRDRLVFHERETLDHISEQWTTQMDPGNAKVGGRQIALERCLGELAPRQRDLVNRFYSDDESLSQIATTQNCRQNTIAVKLCRIRKKLADCIRMRLKQI